MSPPSSPTRLPKWPFLVADAAFLGAAALIAGQSARPLDGTTAMLISGCVGAAALCGLVPFIWDYGRKVDETLDDRQRALEALAQTITTAGEQIGVAANGLRELAEMAQRALKHAEQVPHRLKEELTELEARFASLREDDREELERELAALRGTESERLESTAEKIARAATDWAKAEASAQKHLNATKSLLSDLDDRLSALKAAAESPPVPALKAPLPIPTLPKSVKSGLDEPAAPAAPQNEPAEHAPPTPTAAKAAEPPPPSSLPQPLASPLPEEHEPQDRDGNGHSPVGRPAGAASDATIVPPAKKKPVKRPAPAAEPSLFGDEVVQVSPEESAPASSVSADGATRLLVTAYIGIGNRLFIRGDGPGLSWDEGVPLQFVSIGKWRWEAPDATQPIRFKLFKNDRDECVSPALPVLEPGRQQELTATF